MKLLSLFSGIGAFEKAKNVPTSDTQLYKQARKFNLYSSS